MQQKMIYKYLGPEVFQKALQNEGLCSFRCSYPSDFNDPYELFLTIDFNQSPELLATYYEAIGELPQLPTTCFSKSPCVIPMWAHYAHGHRGVVLEFNETLFLKKFTKVGFGDVDYCDSASNYLLDMLKRACHIKKARYFFLLQKGVFSAAYYTKHSHWSYEQERRLVVGKNHIKVSGELMFLEFPVDYISSIIVGFNANSATKKIAKLKAKKINAKYFELKISKFSPEPYFIGGDGEIYKFGATGITKWDFICEECEEPITEGNFLCPWCSLEDSHKEHARLTNPLRAFQRAGFLEKYYKDMNAISKKHNT